MRFAPYHHFDQVVRGRTPPTQSDQRGARDTAAWRFALFACQIVTRTDFADGPYPTTGSLSVRTFQKRHVLSHKMGVIAEEYGRRPTILPRSSAAKSKLDETK